MPFGFVTRLFKSRYKSNGKVYMIPTEDIQPNPQQPRRAFSYEKLLLLAQSISENGIMQPVTVTFVNDRPVLISGERRLRAAKIAGLKTIPCIEVVSDNATSALMTLLENLQREDLNCFESAEGIRRLVSDYAMTQEQVAQRLGCNQSTVANRMRLLRLGESERSIIIAEGLTERHARALLRLEDVDLRRDMLARIVRDKLNVAQTERLVEDVLRGKCKRRRPIPLVRDVRLFFNTVNHAVDTMRRSGIKASAERNETEEYIEYVVRIPKVEALAAAEEAKA